MLEQRTINWRTSARSYSRTSNKLRCCAGNERWGGSAGRGSSQANRRNPTKRALPAAITPAQFASLSAHWLLPGNEDARPRDPSEQRRAAHAESDHLDNAARLYSQACEVLDEKGCEEPRATALFSLDPLQQQRKEHERVAECLKHAWDLIREIALHTPKALMTLGALGRARFSTDDRRPARSAFLGALELYEDVCPKVAVDELRQRRMFRVTAKSPNCCSFSACTRDGPMKSSGALSGERTILDRVARPRRLRLDHTGGRRPHRPSGERRSVLGEERALIAAVLHSPRQAIETAPERLAIRMRYPCPLTERVPMRCTRRNGRF